MRKDLDIQVAMQLHDRMLINKETMRKVVLAYDGKNEINAIKNDPDYYARQNADQVWLQNHDKQVITTEELLKHFEITKEEMPKAGECIY